MDGMYDCVIGLGREHRVITAILTGLGLNYFTSPFEFEDHDPQKIIQQLESNWGMGTTSTTRFMMLSERRADPHFFMKMNAISALKRIMANEKMRILYVYIDIEPQCSLIEFKQNMHDIYETLAYKHLNPPHLLAIRIFQHHDRRHVIIKEKAEDVTILDIFIDSPKREIDHKVIGSVFNWFTYRFE